MKRFTAAAVAAATAISLSTSAAFAAEDASSQQNSGSSSNNFVSAPHDGSTEASSESSRKDDWKTWDGFYGSSYKNDIANKYPAGTTADILWGVGIAAVALLGAGAFAFVNGMVPGLNLG